MEKALRSVFSQSFTDWELIVVDDGSTDNSAEIAEGILAEFSQKAQLVRQQNAGVSTARNIGVGFAKGEFVCFLDADDWWDENFLSEMHDAILQFPDAGIYASNYWYVKNGKQRVCVKASETGYIDYVRTYLQQFELGGGMPIWTGAVAVKKSIFESLKGFRPNLKLGEDFDLWLRIALKYKVGFLNKPLAFYNQDVEMQSRAIKKLHEPVAHEVFNYGVFAEAENENPDLKLLLDKKRAIGLFQYYLSKQYRELAKLELAKVNWQHLPQSARKIYQRPIWYLKFHQQAMAYASKVKRTLLALINP